jgi:hypothetical protein
MSDYEKIDLIKQIYDYELKGFNINKKPSITNTIEELKFELHRLHYKELKLNDTKEFQIYKQLCKYLDSKQ